MRAAQPSRRVALTYRLDPTSASAALPTGVRPRLVRGSAIGVALVTTPERQRALPFSFGLSFASCAHGVIADWSDGSQRGGLFVLRRDLDARWLGPAGGLPLPGSIHGARFHAEMGQLETGHTQMSLAVQPLDGCAQLALVAQPVPDWPRQSVFQGSAEALSLLGMRCGALQPLGVVRASDTWFEGAERFSAGAATFDSAMVVQHLVSLWRERHNARRESRLFAVPAADAAPA